MSAASNSIADKQLREAIEKALKEDNQLLDENGYRPIDIGKLLQLFHTYGNRERTGELNSLKTKKVKGAELVEMKWIDNRIAELNREVES